MCSTLEGGILARRLDKFRLCANTEKGNTKQCTNYRTVALVPHANKIILKILQERIKKKTEKVITDDQGFRPGKGTRDQITNLRIIIMKMYIVQKYTEKMKNKKISCISQKNINNHCTCCCDSLKLKMTKTCL